MRSYLPSFVILLSGCGRVGYELLERASLVDDDPGGGVEPFDGAVGPPVDDGGRDAAVPAGDGGPDAPPGEAGALDASDGPPADAGADAASDGSIEPQPPPTFSRTCSFAEITVIQNGRIADDSAAMALSLTLQGACLGTKSITYVSQDDPGVLDPDTGRPLVDSSQLIVTAGGPTVHRAMEYLNANDSPVVSSVDAEFRYELRERDTGDLILSEPSSAFTRDRDVAIIEVVFEPSAQTTTLAIYGNEQPGTLAAVQWFNHHMPEPFFSNTKRFYVVEWVERDGEPGPSENDRYTILASG